MTAKSIFTKTLFISLLGHITLFGIFSVSFGNRLPQLDYAAVYFWGQLLRNSQVLGPEPAVVSRLKPVLQLPVASENKLILPKGNTLAPDKVTTAAGSSAYRLKPALALSFAAQKSGFVDAPGTFSFTPKKREPLLLFHPLLPYDFTLYFKDRQIAHVELMFNIESRGRRSVIMVKRKISSGNLEVDLLSARYIGHYLFIQQSRFLTDKWQTVKIDLSED
jgi:hypothetical protein